MIVLYSIVSQNIIYQKFHDRVVQVKKIENKYDSIRLHRYHKILYIKNFMIELVE